MNPTTKAYLTMKGTVDHTKLTPPPRAEQLLEALVWAVLGLAEAIRPPVNGGTK